MTKDKMMRSAEYAFLMFIPWGLGTSTGWEWEWYPEYGWDTIDSWQGDWQELLLLAAWCIAPIVIRPLTTPGVSVQKRYAVTSLILGSGLAWFLWCAEGLGDYYRGRPGGVTVLTILGLLAVAGYLRTGWGVRTKDTDQHNK